MSDSITPFATLFTVLLSKKYNMDMTIYGALLAVNTFIINYLISDRLWNKILDIDVSYFYTFIAVVICYYFLIYKYQSITNYIFYNKEPVYRILNINSGEDNDTFMNYIKFFPEFYENPLELQIGTINYDRTGNVDNSIIKTSDRRVANDVRVNFNDTKFNVKGFYIWKRRDIVIGTEKESGKDIVKTMNYIQLNVDEHTCKDVLKYFNDIETIVFNKKILHPDVECSFMKYSSIVKGSSSLLYIPTEWHTLYYGVKKTPEELEPLYISTFFSHEKDRLWKLAKQIHTNPMEFFKMGQSPQIGWLLHGPPGTGKSSFAYRLAMTLQRNIVLIDIRSLKKRDAIFQIIRKPTVSGITIFPPSSNVYIFDEFDLTVTELYAREKRKEKITDEWINLVQSTSGFVNHTVEKKDGETKEIISLDTMMGTSSDDISLTDLLELFQGPVPMKGAIIIATTNKYEEIKKMCPALVRPGRLTPVYFGNPDSKTINEISNHYFQKDIDISPNYVPSISSAQIMNYVMEAKTDSNKGYDYFVKQINGKINNKNEA